MNIINNNKLLFKQRRKNYKKLLFKCSTVKYLLVTIILANNKHYDEYK